MQVYANSNRLSLKTVLFFAAVLFFAYLPITSFQFFLKNDAFSGYFPPKFFMSESIHAGQLPLWNPYINFGIPQYADMSSGYWSPITWLIASTVGYNAYTLTLEVLFYILLAGIGIYKLLTYWQIDSRVRIIAGVAFMCCGYNVGHMQHFNWLSGAAFLPWCLWSYLLLVKQYSIKNLLRTALLFYFLISSAHPGISIGAVYFFVALLFFQLFEKNSDPIKTKVKSLWHSHWQLLLLVALLSSGMLASYQEILPHFVRGEKIDLQSSLSNPTNFQSWASILFPFSTVKNENFFATDISMRNCYFSITLLLFFFTALFRLKDHWQKFLFFCGLAFALLSSGGIFKTFAYNFLPGIGYVRLNGEFRIFAILCFIILSAIELNKFLIEKRSFSNAVKWVYYCLEAITVAFIIYGLYKAFTTKDSFTYSLKTILQQNGFAGKLKMLVDFISFYDTLWLQGLIQLFVLWAVKYSLQKNNFNLLKKIVVIDVIIASLLNIPYTGAGKASVAQVQAVLNKSPRGLPVPTLQAIKLNDTLSIEEKGLVGDWSMYNKQIGTINEVAYPIRLKYSNYYFSQKDTGFNVKDCSFIFSTNVDSINQKNFTNYTAKDTSQLNIISYLPTKFSFTLNPGNNNHVTFLQSNYKNWYYTLKGEKRTIRYSFNNFIGVPVVPNKVNEITISFEPTFIKWMMLVSLISFITCTVFYFIKR